VKRQLRSDEKRASVWGNTDSAFGTDTALPWWDISMEVNNREVNHANNSQGPFAVAIFKIWPFCSYLFHNVISIPPFILIGQSYFL
jgi:hypothetical protein